MFNVTPIPAFNDNYIWAISLPEQNAVAVVDPGDAQPVLDYLKSNNLSLCAILITHHHNDHTGGVSKLTESFDVPVYGPANSPFKGITHPLSKGDKIDLLGKTLTINEIPGHTLDHISYYTGENEPQLFCGDTLFLAGCGRLFEGTAAQMLEAMDYFAEMPDNTEVYCTHEYSLANLDFAVAVEPNNNEIKATVEQCKALRADDQPTLPSTIGQEKQINPFMRTHHADVIQAANNFSGSTLENKVAIFASIREWKNQF
ncbi:hydroxyacylglutathione hydrolase [Neptuniibacter sp.]|uniref:hydroxyacylglutathione hydrolase n=1 Tax=Neptuniibacter sp. TaxID=1962643 RepID=UPI002623E203|nr:hydroxyacylglutathione hydrolase [Neptuniibacter sp.]MCP4595848.1 hydroxyacylglutathione hydrolase [Neptuniibacter sp.]